MVCLLPAAANLEWPWRSRGRAGEGYTGVVPAPLSRWSTYDALPSLQRPDLLEAPEQFREAVAAFLTK